MFESQIEESKEDTEAILGLARIRVKQGHFDQVNELIQKVAPGSSDYDKAQALLAQIPMTCPAYSQNIGRRSSQQDRSIAQCLLSG